MVWPSPIDAPSLRNSSATCDAVEFRDRGAHQSCFALELLARNPVEGRGMLACQDFDQPVEILKPLGGRQVELLLGRPEESLRVLRLSAAQ